MRDVREDASGEVQTACALLDDGVRRALHEAVVAACIDHPAHQGVQADGVGRRVRRLDFAAVDAVDDRRDQPRAVAQRAHQVVEQRCGSRLAVGAGDAHEPQLAARVVVEGRGHVGHGPRGIRHADVGDPRGGHFGDPFADDGRGPCPDGRRDEVMAVAQRARHGEETVARADGPRVVGEAVDGGFRIAEKLPDGGCGEQFREFFHGYACFFVFAISGSGRRRHPGRSGFPGRCSAARRRPVPRSGPAGCGFRAGRGHP